MSASPRTRRLTAEQRREQVVCAAISEFAATGYHGTSTEAIAHRAGISQPYLFRLYRTKKDLFIACVERCFDRTLETFRDAAERTPREEDRLQSMGWAYVTLMQDRELMLFQLQTYAATSDDDIRKVARRRYRDLAQVIAELTGEDHNGVIPFVGQGLLLNVAAALELSTDQWIFQRG